VEFVCLKYFLQVYTPGSFSNERYRA